VPEPHWPVPYPADHVVISDPLRPFDFPTS
jgi:UDP-N-acetylmuramoyl-L-alanyl-D-glutamate--2,6-diaminopimelate ligase